MNIYTNKFVDLGRSAKGLWLDDQIFMAAYASKTELGKEIYMMKVNKKPIGEIIRHIQSLSEIDKKILREDLGEGLIGDILRF